MGRGQKRAILLGLDALSAALATLGALCLVAQDAASLRGLPVSLAVAAVLAAGASALGGLDRMKLNAFAAHGALRLAIIAAALTAGLLGLGFFAGGGLHAAAAALLFGLLFLLFALGLRLGLRATVLWSLRDGLRQPVLIWGAGDTGIRLAAALGTHPAVAPAAFIDENPSLRGLLIGGLKVHLPDEIVDLARRTRVDRVLIALPEASARRREEIAAGLSAIGLSVMAVPSFAQIAGLEETGAGLLPQCCTQFLGRQPRSPDLAGAEAAYGGKSVLVTGAGGSVGSELCRQLLALGPRRIVLLDVSEAALYTIDADLRARDAPGTEIVPVLGSIADQAMLARLMARHSVAVVLHAAAHKHVPMVEANPLAGLSNNVLGTRAVAAAALRAGVERFVLVSTDKAVRPTGVMGLSKRLAEFVVQDLGRTPAGTAIATVRFGNVLGSSGSVIPLFREQIERGGPLTLTHEDTTRYFMTLAEAARLVLLSGAMASPGSAALYVLDMGAPVRIRDLAEQMIAAAGRTVQGPGNPDGDIAIRITGLRPGEKLHEELLVDGDLLPTRHPKVLRAKERPAVPPILAATLLTLRSALAQGDAATALEAAWACIAGETGSAPPAAAAVPGPRSPRRQRTLLRA